MDEKNENPSLATAVDEERDLTPWYAIRLYSNSLSKVADFFKENGMEYFVPMQYRDYMDENGKHRRKLRPVVSNLIFVKKTVRQQAMSELLIRCQYKMSVITRKYLSSEESRLKVGTPVLVKHGPLKGLSGRLVRQSHKYFLLKEVPGLGVMLKVSRWCCQPIETKNPKE